MIGPILTGRPLGPEPHFLQRVIDAAFERANLLEPRRPSLFERQTVDIHDSGADDQPPAGDDEYRALRSHEDHTEQTLRVRVSRDDRLLSRCSRSDDGASIDHALGAMPQGTRPMAHLEPDTAMAASERASVQIPVERSRAAPPQAVPPPARSSIAIAMVAPSLRPVPPQAIRSALRSRPEPADVPDVPAVRRLDRRERLAVEPAADQPGGTSEPQPPPAVTPAPEPIVNVTIGRIEVRVAPSQAPPVRVRPEGPKPMTLDAYLQQRAGRR